MSKLWLLPVLWIILIDHVYCLRHDRRQDVASESSSTGNRNSNGHSKNNNSSSKLQHSDNFSSSHPSFHHGLGPIHQERESSGYYSGFGTHPPPTAIHHGLQPTNHGHFSGLDTHPSTNRHSIFPGKKNSKWISNSDVKRFSSGAWTPHTLRYFGNSYSFDTHPSLNQGFQFSDSRYSQGFSTAGVKQYSSSARALARRTDSGHPSSYGDRPLSNRALKFSGNRYPQGFSTSGGKRYLSSARTLSRHRDSGHSSSFKNRPLSNRALTVHGYRKYQRNTRPSFNWRPRQYLHDRNRMESGNTKKRDKSYTRRISREDLYVPTLPKLSKNSNKVHRNYDETYKNGQEKGRKRSYNSKTPFEVNRPTISTSFPITSPKQKNPNEITKELETDDSSVTTLFVEKNLDPRVNVPKENNQIFDPLERQNIIEPAEHAVFIPPLTPLIYNGTTEGPDYYYETIVLTEAYPMVPTEKNFFDEPQINEEKINFFNPKTEPTQQTVHIPSPTSLNDYQTMEEPDYYYETEVFTEVYPVAPLETNFLDGPQINEEKTNFLNPKTEPIESEIFLSPESSSSQTSLNDDETAEYSDYYYETVVVTEVIPVLPDEKNLLDESGINEDKTLTKKPSTTEDPEYYYETIVFTEVYE